MSKQTQQKRCQATTKSGERCKLKARPGSDYCHIHQDQAEQSQAAPEMADLVADLDALVEDLRQTVPEYSPPPYSPEGLLRLLRDNIDRFSPEMVRNVMDNLQGVTPRDLLDADTWKGLWYLLNYTLQTETTAAREKLAAQWARLPGAGTVSGIQAMFTGASPRDFLELETWKGVWFLLDYTVRSGAEDVRRRVLGEKEGEETNEEEG